MASEQKAQKVVDKFVAYTKRAKSDLSSLVGSAGHEISSIAQAIIATNEAYREEVYTADEVLIRLTSVKHRLQGLIARLRQRSQ